MSTTKIDKLIITGLSEETATKPVLVWNPVTRRVSWQTSPNARIAALEAKLDTNNNFKTIPEPPYSLNPATRVLTMNAGWVGTINGIDYTNLAEQVFTAIPLAASGYSRIDMIVFKTDSTFERIPGTPSTFTPVAPTKPANTLEATFVTVSDGVVDVPVTPKPKSPVTSVNGMRGDVVIPKATDIVAGLVKTDVAVAEPVVYVKETVDNLLDGKANYFLDIKTITGITYNVILTDILHELVYAGTLAMNVIIPNNSTVAFPIGTIFYTLGTNTGIITASGAAGVTLSLKAGLSLSAIQNEVRQYTKIGTNTWSVRGDLNLGAVTQTELSYLQGVTSNIQAQINAKTSLSGGTANFLMKWLTATTATVSRIWDTGTFLGIGTAKTPTKDITLGNQGNREIGVEESSNIASGKDLNITAGRTINYVENANFNSLNQISRIWVGMTAKSNGDIYASVSGGTIYVQSGGSGDFIDTGIGFDAGQGGLATAPNGDIYATNQNQLYKQTGGTGSFVSLAQTVRAYQDVAVAPNGDVYACVQSGDIYKQTGGTGSFVALGQTARNWKCITVAPNGDVYCNEVYGDIYKQTGGTGSFVALGQGGKSAYGLEAAANGNIYCSTDTAIYMQTAGAGNFNVIYSSPGMVFRGIAIAPNGNVYVANYTLGIYMQQNNGAGSPNLDGGTLRNKAGTGKGTGKSRYEIYTGQKLASGTDMQTETLREYIDENGYHVYTSMPVYADNAAAITGGLPVGCEYRTATGVKMIVY